MRFALGVFLPNRDGLVVQRGGKDFQGGTIRRAPFRGAGAPGALIRPRHEKGTRILVVADVDVQAENFLGKGVQMFGGNPWRPEAHADVFRLQWLGLNLSQRLDIAAKTVVGGGGRLRFFQFGHHVAGQVLVGHLPIRAGNLVDGVSEFPGDRLPALARQFGHMTQVQSAPLVQTHHERVIGILDLRRDRTLDGPTLEKFRFDDPSVVGNFFKLLNKRGFDIKIEQFPALVPAVARRDFFTVLVFTGPFVLFEFSDEAMLFDKAVIKPVQFFQGRFPIPVLKLIILRLLQGVAQFHIALEPFMVGDAQFGHSVDAHPRAILKAAEQALVVNVQGPFLGVLGVEIPLGYLAARGIGGAAHVRGVDLFRKVRHGFRKLRVNVRSPGQNRIFVGPVHASLQAVFPQHHFRMSGKVFVDQGRALRRLHFGPLLPRVPSRRFRSRVLLERGLRQPDRAQQIRPPGHVLPGLVVSLVHGALAGDEHQQAAGAHLVQRLGEEIVVQKEAVFLVGGIVQNLGGRERRIADGQIEKVVRQFLFDEIGVENGGFRQQVAGDSGRGLVHFHAGVLRPLHDFGRRGHGKEPGAHARLQNSAAPEPQTFQAGPDGSDHGLGGIMRVLGGLESCGDFFRRKNLRRPFGQRTPIRAYGIRIDFPA